ncbi:MAG TPA: flagellar biosynthetic protein FliO [Duganella sp.]|jgi:flagellar protein FliO/FliZ
MKPGPTLSLILAASIAALAVPALAQNAPTAGKPASASSVAPATTAAPAATAAPAITPTPAPTAMPATAAAAPAPLASDVAGAPKPSSAETAATDPVTGAPASASTNNGAATANGAPATAATAATPPGPLAMTIPTPQPTSSATGGLLQTTFALLFVLALLLGGAWFVKRFGPKNFGGGGGTVKLVGSLSLGTRERILVVEVGDQWIVVGASPGRINQLATMPRQANADAAVPATLQTANFADWFKQTIDKRNGK